MDIHKLAKLLDFLSEETDPEIQLNTLRAFLVVGLRGSCTQKDVEAELGTSNASASRNVSYWTDQKADRRPGLNFILRMEDPHDRRYKLLRLTERGQEFMERLENL